MLRLSNGSQPITGTIHGDWLVFSPGKKIDDVEPGLLGLVLGAVGA